MPRRNTPPSRSRPTPPNLWTYRDARDYLRDVCAFKREHEKGFSFRKLARYADLGSPNYLQMYLQGHRTIKVATARRIAEALDLKPAEQEFFQVLVAFSHAADDDEKAGWYAELLERAVRDGGTGTLDAARLNYFTHWFIPVVHAMASLKGFRPQAHWIAARVVPKIRPFDAQKALDVLRDLGIFGSDDAGAFVVREPRLETSDGLRSLWIREYHRAMIRLSEKAIDFWSPDRRVTAALTVTVPHAMINDVLARVETMRRDVFSWLMAAQADMESVDGEVMQINFQAYPLTDLEASS